MDGLEFEAKKLPLTGIKEVKWVWVRLTLGDDGHQASVKVSCLGLGSQLSVSGGYVSGLGLVGPSLVNIPVNLLNFLGTIDLHFTQLLAFISYHILVSLPSYFSSMEQVLILMC